MTAFFTSVLAGWLWRRALEVGGISTLVFQIYEALPNVAKVAITDLLTGHPERISLVAAAGVISALWGYWASYKATMQPKSVTKVGGTLVSIPEKKMADSTVEKVKASAGAVVAERKGTTLADIIGGLFKRN